MMGVAPHHHKRLRGEGFANGVRQPHLPLTNGSGFSGAITGNAKPCLKFFRFALYLIVHLVHFLFMDSASIKASLIVAVNGIIYGFFSTCGCPYGEGCHFSHYVAGGISALATLGFGPGQSGFPSLAAPSASASDATVNLGGYKTRICNQFGTPDGCRFGDKCHFAHGGRELHNGGGGALSGSSHLSSNLAAAPLSTQTSRAFLGIKDITSTNSLAAGADLPREPSPPGITTSLGACSSEAKVSIGTGGGLQAKEYTHFPGARLTVWDHEKDPNLRNYEFEGTHEPFKTANEMVKVLLVRKDPLPPKSAGFSSHKYKTKMCENFARGMCTFGERCHFAHGDAELRKSSFPAS